MKGTVTFYSKYKLELLAIKVFGQPQRWYNKLRLNR